MLSLQEKVKSAPKVPGVYLFKKGVSVIYVGKAKSLNNRLKQYFSGKYADTKTEHLVSCIEDVEYIITETEHQALILECDLIKRYKPKYNILLKDGKGYPYIKISYGDNFPGIYYFRGKLDTENKYFGPYTNMRSLRESLEQIQKIFRIRTCTNSYFANRTRPCMLYQIKRCSGPCVNMISKDEYQKSIQRVELFLRGKSDEIAKDLEQKMNCHVEKREYEDAAVIRDQIHAIRQMQKKQDISSIGGNYDVFHFTFSLPVVKCYYLSIRFGKIYENKSYLWQDIFGDSDSEMVSSLLVQFYRDRPHNNITHIITNIKPDVKDNMEHIISSSIGKKIHIVYKPQAEKAQWLKMAAQNSEYCSDAGLYNVLLNNLSKELKLANTPKHIECFDISHTSGTNTTASCVVFNNGVVDKKAARYLKITPKVPGDDYEAISLAVFRRYNKKLTELEQLPDLIIIDGGKGQYNSALKAIIEMGIDSIVDLISISKGEGRVEGLETIHFDDKSIPLNKDLPHHKLLLRIRNEAHNYALKKHVKARNKTSLKSILLDIPHIGPKKRKALLSHFANINDIKNCSVSDLEQVEGINIKLATIIKNFFED